ncbi:MAG: ABC transporter ATP-binding protein [Alphaproteobacteria bacterium]|nr:ABC transporter ATP-binding protein [Alphaproteobacteria bacterium]
MNIAPIPSDNTLVEVRDVHVTLKSDAGAVNILRGASLTVAAGEAVGLVGPSGSGKSTLLAVVAGLERASSGHVAVAGRDLAALDEDQLAVFRRRHIGIVFQSFHLVPTMNALENVAVPLELAGVHDAFAHARARLDAVGLSHRVTHYPAQLSGGEQQRVALARAFAADPKIVLADEPTGNLDSATGRSIVDLMFKFRAERRTTLLLVTHDMELAVRCGRVVRMDDGRILDPIDLEQPKPVHG